MPPAYVCPKCEVEYPPAFLFAECPSCEVETELELHGDPIPFSAAETIEKRALFDRFYERYDANRKGPTPEELGSEDAKKEIERKRNGG